MHMPVVKKVFVFNFRLPDLDEFTRKERRIVFSICSNITHRECCQFSLLKNLSIEGFICICPVYEMPIVLRLLGLCVL